MSWIDIGALDDIKLRGARIVKSPVGCIALFRTGEEKLASMMINQTSSSNTQVAQAPTSGGMHQ